MSIPPVARACYMPVPDYKVEPINCRCQETFPIGIFLVIGWALAIGFVVYICFNKRK